MIKKERELELYKKLPSKPLAVIDKMIGHFEPDATPLLGRYGDDEIQLMDKNAQHYVIFFREGCVDVWRNHDHLLVATAAGPAILGLQGSTFRYSTHTFRRHKSMDIQFLPLSSVLKIIRDNDLLEDVLTYQAYLNDHQTYRDFLMVNNSAYSIICMLLTELSLYPDCQDISVEKFILARTRLARSGVLKILADLRFGGFIEMEKGKLIRLCFPFPNKY
jgi:hypothetical protein